MKSIPIQYKNKSDCCGCRACANVCPQQAISFVKDEYGFLYPKIDDTKCVGCNLCVHSCDFQQEKGVQQGYPLKGFAAVNRNALVLKNSSSGGVFSALAELILSQHGVVYGCVLSQELSPVHIAAYDHATIEKMRGSKYVQSDIGYIYNDVKKSLRDGKKVLFTGTPCQVAALYTVLKGENLGDLLTADFVCHGVPSDEMFQQYIGYLEEKYHGKISDYRFRTKRKGWGNYMQSLDISCNNNNRTKHVGAYDEFYFPSFRAGNLNRLSCYHCKYACSNRVADITMADFWGYGNAGISLNVNKGLSACLINTPKALSLFPLLERYLVMQSVDPQLIIKGNGQLNTPIKKGERWDYYMGAIKNGEVKQVAIQYRIDNKRVIIKSHIKNMIPTPIISMLRTFKKMLRNAGKRQ